MAFSDVDKGMAKKVLKHYCSSWDELRYDEVRNKPYFIGKRLKESTTEVLFPIDCYKSMTFDELKTCIVDSGSNSMNLAVYNSDSTVVLYKAQLGLKPPIHQETEMPSVSDNPEATTSKRSFDSTASTSVCQEQISETDYLQIDTDTDSEMSETENEDSEESNTCLEDKPEVIYSQN